MSSEGGNVNKSLLWCKDLHVGLYLAHAIHLNGSYPLIITCFVLLFSFPLYCSFLLIFLSNIKCLANHHTCSMLQEFKWYTQNTLFFQVKHSYLLTKCVDTKLSQWHSVFLHSVFLEHEGERFQSS